MQIVSVKNTPDNLSMQKEYTQIEHLIEKAKINGLDVIYLEHLSYHSHMLLIKQDYQIKKFVKRASLFFFLRKPKKYYAIRFPVEKLS